MDDKNYNQNPSADGGQPGTLPDDYRETGAIPPTSNYPYPPQQPRPSQNWQDTPWAYSYPVDNTQQVRQQSFQPAPASNDTGTVNRHKARRRSGPWGAISAVLLVLIAGLLIFLVASNNKITTVTSTNPTSATPVATAPAASAPTTANTTGQMTVRQVAEAVRPAIVQITSQQTVPNSTNPFFGGGSNGSQVETGVGSGVIYDKSGLILTNFHVIDGADKLLVSLPDGRSFDATVVGSDQQTDLAVVKIDPKGADLPLAQLGDSSALHVGDGVVAIGNALALPGGPTVTSGVVSALNRSVTEPGTETQNPFGRSSASSGPQLYGMIQTDAAINPGNSGGALVDMQGQVIGINTLVAGQAEPGVQAQGIGFAISINEAKDIAQQLVANGKVDHPFMGISYQPLTPAIAKQLNLDTTLQGSVLAQVQSGSPAAQAGLKARDVIVAIDGKKITTESTLGEVINQHKPGDKVQLEVITPQSSGGNSQSHTVTVTLGQRTAS